MTSKLITFSQDSLTEAAILLLEENHQVAPESIPLIAAFLTSYTLTLTHLPDEDKVKVFRAVKDALLVGVEYQKQVTKKIMGSN